MNLGAICGGMPEPGRRGTNPEKSGGGMRFAFDREEKISSSDSSGSPKMLSCDSRAGLENAGRLRSSRTEGCGAGVGTAGVSIRGCGGGGGGGGAAAGAGAIFADGEVARPPSVAGAWITCLQCGQRTCRPSRSRLTPMRRPQNGQGKIAFAMCVCREAKPGLVREIRGDEPAPLKSGHLTAQCGPSIVG